MDAYGHKNKVREKRIQLASEHQVSAEVERLLALRRTIRDPGEAFEVPYRRPNWKPKSGNLWPEQRRSLKTISRTGGLFGVIACGFGKGLIANLAPQAARAKRPVLVLPATLRKTYLVEREKFMRLGWKVSLRYTVLSYEQLSRPDATKRLLRLNPDFIFFDEVHNIANASAARVGRVARFIEKRPKVKIAAVSGSVTGRSILDYAHILLWALKGSTPLPIDFEWLKAWADVLDEQKDHSPASSSWPYLLDVIPDRYLDDRRQHRARRGYGKYLRRRRGVVSTGSKTIATGLIYGLRKPDQPSEIREAIHSIKFLNERPDGEEEIASPLDRARNLQTIQCGFYYKWIWPNGEPDTEWLDARANWHRVVRAVIESPKKYVSPKFRGDPREVDTEKLVRVAHRRGLITHKRAKNAWKAWSKLRKRYSPTPPKEVCWLSDYLIQDTVEWARALLKEKRRGIIWYYFGAQEEAFARAGIPTYPQKDIVPNEKDPIIALSLKRHGTGLNLQAWDSNLVTCWHTSGRLMEQVIARTHRNGQKSDDVAFSGYEHDLEAIRTSVRDAAYIQDSLQAPQRLLLGTWSGEAREKLSELDNSLTKYITKAPKRRKKKRTRHGK